MPKIRIVEDPPKILFRLETFLERNDLTPIEFLAAFLDGELPAPVRVAGGLFLDADDCAQWRVRRRADSRNAQASIRARVHDGDAELGSVAWSQSKSEAARAGNGPRKFVQPKVNAQFKFR